MYLSLSTVSSVSAAPLWKYGGKAKTLSRDGGTKPAAPSGGLPFCRTSFLALESNVPTLVNCAMICPSLRSAAVTGMVGRALLVHFGPPWQDWQLLRAKI